MTRKRSTASEKKQRLEWAMKKIDQGVGFSELASLVAETWGCSRRNARRVVSDAHKEWMDIAFGAEEIDQRDLLFQQVARLERTARKAEEAGQFAVGVGVESLSLDDQAIDDRQRKSAYGSLYRGAERRFRRVVEMFKEDPAIRTVPSSLAARCCS